MVIAIDDYDDKTVTGSPQAIANAAHVVRFLKDDLGMDGRRILTGRNATPSDFEDIFGKPGDTEGVAGLRGEREGALRLHAQSGGGGEEVRRQGARPSLYGKPGEPLRAY